MEIWSKLFDPTGFVPRAQCGAWTPALIRLHNLSDFFIWTAYLAIPLVLVAFSYKRRADLPFRPLFWLFGLFIVACGSTHLMDIVLFYNPLYRLSGLIKLITAVASWCTVVGLISVMPHALAMKSPRVLEREIDERKRMAEQLRLSEERFRASFEAASIGKALVDLNGHWLKANQALCDLVGYTEAELLDLTFQDITHLDDLDCDLNHMRQLLEGTRHDYQMEKRYIHKRGHEVWILLSVSMVHDGHGQPLHFIAEVLDITERKQLEEMRRQRNDSLEQRVQQHSDENARLHILAVTDGLTGLSNRRAFDESLQREFERARRYQTALSVLILDVDHFKDYNDTFGHPAGDLVLQQLARLLRCKARSSDVIARYGGEEFAVILPGTAGEGADIFAEHLLQDMAATTWPGRPVTASFGVCALSSAIATQDSQTLIDAADKALYQSKSTGRNRVTHAPETV